MKRLFAYLGLTLICALTVVFYLGFWGAVAVWVVSTVIAICALFVKRFSAHKVAMIIVSLTAIFASLYSITYTAFVFNLKSQEYDGQTVQLTAKVTDTPVLSYNTYYYELKSFKINDETKEYKIMLKSPSEIDADYGDIITTTVLLEKCQKNYYLADKYIYTASSPDYYLSVTVDKQENKGLQYIPIYIKEKMLYALKVIIPGEEGNLCRAVALGDKNSLSKDVLDMFNKTGLTYLIVVSGLHMSIFSSFVIFLFKKFSKRKAVNFVRHITIIMLVFLFMSVTGFTPSVVRSGITIILTYSGNMFNRKADPINNLGIAGFLLTIFNPYAVGDIGMLFSFASVFGILVLYTPVSRKLHIKYYTSNWRKPVENPTRKYKVSRFVVDKLVWLLDAFILSIVAVIFVTPISLIFMGTCTPYTPLFSIFITPVISVLLIATLLCSVLWYVPIISNLAYIGGIIAYYLAKWVLFVVRLGAKFPFVQITVNSTCFIVWLLISVVCIGVAYLIKNNRKVIKLAVTYSLVLSLFILPLSHYQSKNQITLNILNSGTGITAVVTGNGTSEMISCGGSSQNTSSVISELKYLNNIDFLLVPGTTNFEARYSAEILKEFDVKSVMLYYRYNINEQTCALAKECENYKEFYTDEKYEVELNNGITDVVVNVSNHTYQYVYNSYTSVLIVPYYGDCEEIPQEYRTADVLVLSQEPDNIDVLNYSEAIWCSDKSVPTSLHDVVTTQETVKISFN